MNYALLITVLLTAITLVVAAYVVAKLIGPRSYAKVKGEPYESGQWEEFTRGHPGTAFMENSVTYARIDWQQGTVPRSEMFDDCSHLL